MAKCINLERLSSSLKRGLITCSGRVNTIKCELMARGTELQTYLNDQPRQVCCAKMRTLVKKT